MVASSAWCADPANLDFRGHAVSRGSDQPHQRAVGIDQVADPQAARLQLRSLKRGQPVLPRLLPRSPMPPWHRIIQPQATANTRLGEVRWEEFELQAALQDHPAAILPTRRKAHFA